MAVVLFVLSLVTQQTAALLSPRAVCNLHRARALAPLRSSESQGGEASAVAESSTMEESSGVELELEPEISEKQKEINRLRAAEKFIEEETGSWECRVCDFKYVQKEGAKGVAPDTEFSDIPSSWRCPRCRSSKDAFVPITVTIAGFKENQQYGFGGNNMTEGSKNGLIFGGLGFFFVLFLSGYLLT